MMDGLKYSCKHGQRAGTAASAHKSGLSGWTDPSGHNKTSLMLDQHPKQLCNRPDAGSSGALAAPKANIPSGKPAAARTSPAVSLVGRE